MSSAQIRVNLFGPLTLYRGKEHLEFSGSTSARTLLAYLLLRRGSPQSRLKMAGIFWPDMDEARSRRSLTQALWRIRNLLPDHLESDAQHILIPKASTLTVDVEIFESLTDSYSQVDVVTQEEKVASAQSLRQAVALYRGNLLEGFYDDWALVERERLRELYLRTLGNLIDIEKSKGNFGEALDYALKLAKVDPFREAAHREVMRLYFALDRPEAALTQYENCVRILDEEFGLEVDQQTRALAQEIAIRVPDDKVPHLPKVVSPVAPWSLDDSRPAQLPLIGRDEVREGIYHVFEEAIRGFGGIVLIEGEAGIGKTRLMTEVMRDAEWRGMQTLWGRNLEGDVSSPYSDFIEALSQGLTSLRINQMSQLIDTIWFRVLLPFVPFLTNEISNLTPAPALPASQNQNRLIQAFVNVLKAWGKITPLLIILDDLHWSNEDNIELLIALAPHLQNTRVILIGTYRGEDAQVRATLWERLGALERSAIKQRIQLKRLTSEATGELIRRSLGLAEPVPLFEKRLYNETQGNPLFILETLRALSDEGILAQDELGNWHTPWDETTSDYTELPLPQAVERTIATRLDRLLPEERTVLSAAAVLGRDFNFSLLSNTAGMEVQQVLSIANSLVRRRFLEEMPNAYQFSHDKIRQVAYESIPEDERRQLHRQAAKSIQQLDAEVADHTELLAHHSYEGQVWEQAVKYNRQAGDHSKLLYANSEAALFFTRALEALAKSSVEAEQAEQADLLCSFELLMDRVAVFDLLGEREHQYADLIALDKLLDHPNVSKPRRKSKVTLCWTQYWETISNYPNALEVVQHAAGHAKQAGDIEMEQQAHLKWGQMLRHLGEYNEAQIHLEKAYQLALDNQDPLDQAVSLNSLGVVFFDNGDYDRAIDHSEQALAIEQPEEDLALLAEIHNNLGGVYHYLADFPTAIEHHQRSLDLRCALGDRRFEASALYNLAITYDDSGDSITARQYLEQVCEICQAIGDRRVEGYGWVFLGLVLEELGELDESRAAYSRGLDLRREVGLHAMANDALAGLARVATAEGNHAEAVEFADQVLSWIEENGRQGIGDPLLAYVGAYRALLEAGETQRGLSALEDAYSLLIQFSESISDPKRRHAYLHDINPGKPIWDDYHAQIKGQALQHREVMLPRAEAPLGRPLEPKDLIATTWTVQTPEDETVQGKSARRQHRLLRLLDEAKSQGAIPTVENLASVLDVSDRTIKRDLAAMREAGHVIETRGST